MATVNLAELPSETRTGAPAAGGSARGYPSCIMPLQQVRGCENAVSYDAEFVRVACKSIKDSQWDP